MAEDTRADAESHFVNGLDYLIPYCGGRIVKKMPLRQFLSFSKLFEKNLKKGFTCHLKLTNLTLSKKECFYTLRKTLEWKNH